MAPKVDEYNQLIDNKKEQIDHLLDEKKEVNNLLNDYHDMIQTTKHFNQHLAERYYESDMFSRIEENNDMFQSGQRQVMNALYEQQSEIDRKIRLTNEDIEDIEKYRNIEMQKEQEGGHTYEY